MMISFMLTVYVLVIYDSYTLITYVLILKMLSQKYGEEYAIFLYLSDKIKIYLLIESLHY